MRGEQQNPASQRSQPLESRMSAAESWINSHEDRCAERYGELRDEMKGLKRVALGALLAIIGWMGAQLWQDKGHIAPPAMVAGAPR